VQTIRSLEQTLCTGYVCGYALTQLFTMNTSVVQDFLQVLSMFAGFNFEWPPAVKSTTSRSMHDVVFCKGNG
jgi:hypothetical protein